MARNGEETNDGEVIVLDADQDQRLDEETVELLIVAEQRGTASVLWIRDATALESPLAGLVTHIAATDPALQQEIRRRIGDARTVPAGSPGEARDVVERAMAPAERADAAQGFGRFRRGLRRRWDTMRGR